MNASSQNKPVTLPCGRKYKNHIPKIDKKFKDRYWARFEMGLKENALHHSKARREVAEVALHFKGHFSTQDLVEASKQKNSKLGAATVYRTLPLLVSIGLVRESLQDENRNMLYEIDHLEHHDHIRCEDCGAILEFENKEIETLQHKLLKKLRFKEVGHKHVLFVKCMYQEDKKAKR